ncbi:hypothetical protein ACI3KT_01565 [Microbacterium sp. ZW T6_19]|uniref:hypothetical protein n=1 Tax=Microbacterium sp. ZW T6_19 TaxID=3378082 RepID=UPI00385391D5
MAENAAGSERRPGKRRGPLIALFAAATIVVGAGAFAISQQPGAGPTPTATSTPTTARTEQPETPAPTNEGDDGDDDVKLGSTNVLDEPKSGQEAIDALGDKIDVVAERNGMTVDELTHLLQTDSTVHISVTGSIYYRDTHTP